MKAKLKPRICYMAGLARKRHEERNRIGIETRSEEIELRFVELAVKELRIEPNKIIVEEHEDGIRRAYFYHSRVAKQLIEIQQREDRLFRIPNEYSCNYLSGMLDSMGRLSSNGGVYIDGLTPQDEVMLANLGIHTRNGRVANISSLIALAGKNSIVLKGSGLVR